jgi:hypothetical protein
VFASVFFAHSHTQKKVMRCFFASVGTAFFFYSNTSCALTERPMLCQEGASLTVKGELVSQKSEESSACQCAFVCMRECHCHPQSVKPELSLTDKDFV